MAGHSAVADNAYPAGAISLAGGICVAGSHLADNKAAVGSSVRHRGQRLGRQEGDRWVWERSSAVASFWGCVCAEQKREEACQDPLCRW